VTLRPASRRFKNAVYDQFARIAKALASPRRIELLEILAQAPRTVEAAAKLADIGVANASQHLKVLRAAGLVACSIFIDAEQADVRAWYFARRRVLRAPGADHVALDVLAERAWLDTNVPNYTQHILLERARADIVVLKAADHSLAGVTER